MNLVMWVAYTSNVLNPNCRPQTVDVESASLAIEQVQQQKKESVSHSLAIV